jgi:hypothetical protein
MSYEELLELEEDLKIILAGRAAEEKQELVGLGTDALKILQEFVGNALDYYVDAEAASARRDYERSV